MDNLTYVFRSVIQMAIYIWTRPVVIFGIQTSYGAVFVWVGLASIIIWFLRGLYDG